MPQRGEPAFSNTGILHPPSAPWCCLFLFPEQLHVSGSAWCLRGLVWVAWPYTGLCGQSQGLKNRLRAEADIGNRGQDGARTGREHAGKKAQCFLRTGMWIKLTLHLRSASYCSNPFICLTTSFCNLLLYTLKIKTHAIVNFTFARLWNAKALPSVHGHLRNVQILYNIYTSVPQAKAPLSTAKCYFLQQVCQMSAGVYFISEPLFIEWKKEKAPTLLLLFNQQDFWMQMNESPL